MSKHYANQKLTLMHSAGKERLFTSCAFFQNREKGVSSFAFIWFKSKEDLSLSSLL